MTLHKKKMVCLWAISTFLFLFAGLTASMAWFETHISSVDPEVTGSVVEAYFHCGTGTQDDPYVITRPIHYYHLVEFYQRKTVDTHNNKHFGTDYLYFQVGYDLDGNEENGLEVYEYNDEGIYTGTETTTRTSKTLNMAYYSGENALMPIGTDEVPFIGVFDGGATNGGGITIKNLSICCSEEVLIGNDTVVRRAKDVGVFGYVADSVSNSPTIIQNARFENLTIDLSDISATPTGTSSQQGVTHETSHDEFNVGYIVGHVHAYTNHTSSTNAAPLANVYLKGSATVKGGAGVNSSFGYVGWIDTSDGNSATSVETGMEAAYTGGSGSGNEWGGSLNVKNYNQWFYYLHGQKAYGDSNNQAMSTGSNTLTGTGYKAAFTASATDDPTMSYLYFYNAATRYLLLNANGTGTLRDGNNNYSISSWEDSHSGTVYGYKITFSSNVTLGIYTSSVFYFNHMNTGASSALLFYRKANHTGNTTSDTGRIKNYTYQFANRNNVVYRGQTGTYLPLAFDSTTWTTQTVNTVSDDNTGYIVGATGSSATNGAVKISSYPISNIVNSISDSAFDMADICQGHGTKNLSFVDSKAEILTYKEGTGWVLIKDSHNENHTVANSNLSPYSSSKTDSSKPEVLFMDPQKYKKSRDKLNEEVLSGATRVHAIHFDTPASGYGIGGNSNIASYTNVKINGQTYASYQLPAGTVDFNLKDDGVINFFAGAYNSSEVNMSFFSLYKVVRNGNNAISSITEIRRIYENPNYDGTNDKYIYSFNGNQPSGVSASNLIKDLDVSLRVNAVPVKNALYYFELPVNSGEYCMAISSNSSNQGAYMMYLDIGASGSESTSTGNQTNHIMDSALFTQIGFTSGNAFFINSCFNIAYVVPAGATKDSFSISVSVSSYTPPAQQANSSESSSSSGEPQAYTCFDVVITNTTTWDSNDPFVIYCLLMDDDDDPNNIDDYLYMYSIKYNNGTTKYYGYSDKYTETSSGTLPGEHEQAA